MLHAQGLDELICAKLQLHTKPANLTRWDKLVDEVEHPQHEVTIAMCGKYVDLSDSYKSLNEALRHAGIHNHARVKIEYVDSEDLTPTSVANLAASTRSWSRAASASAASKARSSPPSSRARTRSRTSASAWACRSRRSSTRATRRARGANSTEFDPDRPHPVIALIDEWEDRDGTIQKRNAQLRPRRHDAPGRAELRRQARHARARDLRQRPDRAAPASLRGQRELPRPAPEAGPGHLGDHPAREAHRGRRAAARAPVVHRRPVPPRVQVDAVGRSPLFKSFISAALAHQAERAEKVA